MKFTINRTYYTYVTTTERYLSREKSLVQKRKKKAECESLQLLASGFQV